MEILYSPAKINLGLWILDKRPDGYHEIFTLYHTLDFYDRIIIQEHPFLEVKTSLPEIKQEENLVYKAISLFESYTGIEQNLQVIIEKNIPVGGGLGGGSSNAATVLNYLNKKHGNILPEEKLSEIAVKLGADVPFFLKGGFAIGEGIGEKLTFLPKTLDEEIFIIYPNIKSDTKTVYSKVDKSILTNKEDLNIILSLINEYDIKKLEAHIENKLGDVALDLYPEIKEVYDFLNYLGFSSKVSGSGSCVYVIGKPTEEVEKAAAIKGWRLIKTKLK
jgi:4-diphosphocytidyl-2-C-methyl-D-erythritol kinase